LSFKPIAGSIRNTKAPADHFGAIFSRSFAEMSRWQD